MLTFSRLSLILNIYSPHHKTALNSILKRSYSYMLNMESEDWIMMGEQEKVDTS